MVLTSLVCPPDDELLYAPQGMHHLHAELAAAPAERPDCHLRNLEALLPSRASASPFRDAFAFRHAPASFDAYTSGKSIGRLDAPTLQAHGPHNFRTTAGFGGRGSEITHQVPAHVAVVLHYESATYAAWQRKYLDLAASHPSASASFEQVPFPFFRQSISAAEAILAARAAADPAAEEKAVAQAQALWDAHKLAPKRLPKAGATPRVHDANLTVLSPLHGYEL